MANRLAPYKDEAIIKQLIGFFNSTTAQSILREVSPFSAELPQLLYRAYIEWQVGHPEQIMDTLNQPQFDKAFAMAVVHGSYSGGNLGESGV